MAAFEGYKCTEKSEIELLKASNSELDAYCESKFIIKACAYINDDGECEEIGHINDYFGVVLDEFIPLYAKVKE